MKRNLFTLLFFIAAVGAVQAQTSRTLSLNGRWRAAVSETQPDTYPSTVPVPGVMSQAEPAPDIDFDATQLKDDVGYDYVWYATEFDLSNPHDGYDNGNYTHALLRIRAKYNALVILNGVEIGYDAHCTYSHAEFDVTRALDFNGPNRLVVRVGSWNTASFPSKDNSSEWWRNSRAPGICDDVTLCLTHDVTVRHLKLLPDVAGGAVVCTARVANFGGEFRKMQARVTINDCRYDLENGFDEIPVVCEARLGSLPIPADSVAEFTFRIPTPMLKPWTPGREGDPQLYQFNFILADDRSADCRTETFGFRDIRVEGRDVLVNGRKTLFRAENIAFQRALNRWADVMFDEAWIRRFLRAAVEDYGFNYLRIHLGHAYNKWYDIADELGLMIQDEWRFMHDDEPAGEDLVQTETEFRRWVEQNVNHPSIVVWDQENEGNVKLEALKTELRRYDPTRLWGEDDFEARHIYEYSETIVDTPVHPVSGARPSTVLESCRLWLNERGDLEPLESFKTSRTASGWGLYFYTLPEIERLQADIHADLGTFYRSRRVQAWAPLRAAERGGQRAQLLFGKSGRFADSPVQPAGARAAQRTGRNLRRDEPGPGVVQGEDALPARRQLCEDGLGLERHRPSAAAPARSRRGRRFGTGGVGARSRSRGRSRRRRSGHDELRHAPQGGCLSAETPPRHVGRPLHRRGRTPADGGPQARSADRGAGVRRTRRAVRGLSVGVGEFYRTEVAARGAGEDRACARRRIDRPGRTAPEGRISRPDDPLSGARAYVGDNAHVR